MSRQFNTELVVWLFFIMLMEVHSEKRACRSTVWKDTSEAQHEAAVLEIKAPHWKEEKVSSGKPPPNSISKL